MASTYLSKAEVDQQGIEKPLHYQFGLKDLS